MKQKTIRIDRTFISEHMQYKSLLIHLTVHGLCSRNVLKQKNTISFVALYIDILHFCPIESSFFLLLLLCFPNPICSPRVLDNNNSTSNLVIYCDCYCCHMWLSCSTIVIHLALTRIDWPLTIHSECDQNTPAENGKTCQFVFYGGVFLRSPLRLIDLHRISLAFIVETFALE